MTFTPGQLYQRSSALMRRVIAQGAIDFVWCQRGGGAEVIELVCAVTTDAPDRTLLVFCTTRGNTVTWFTATLYTTTEATEAAGLVGCLNYHFRSGRVTMGIKSELIDYPFRTLSRNLEGMGIDVLVQQRLGIRPKRYPHVFARNGGTYARAA